ncbi:TlpA family protein disulfide reductase [Anaerosphaera multitolerans]|uniref:TlpA family protein disulfide reductase n=1 Tax=Anaerosphaera multitolerans TaxID=2487351 RepID=A0A437S6F7_9FIRM|nr:TlpA disulfide reductase family protein [Anaerosphaera multitolerans]RVU54581.1 TlpA family protein disulfide reductase [Anaerosphaera multitolerans]
MIRNLKSKGLSLLLIFTLTLGLVACNNKENTINTSNSSGNTTNDSLEDMNIYEELLGYTSIDLNASSIDGEIITNDIFKNSKVTMVNFWATFCGPCIREMPDLAELHNEYNEEDFQIIGIIGDTFEGSDNNMAKAKTLIAENNVSFTNIIPNNDLYSNYIDGKIQGFPTTIFIDSQGNLIGNIIVGSNDKENWKSIIDETLSTIN